MSNQGSAKPSLSSFAGVRTPQEAPKPPTAPAPCPQASCPLGSEEGWGATGDAWKRVDDVTLALQGERSSTLALMPLHPLSWGLRFLLGQTPCSPPSSSAGSCLCLTRSLSRNWRFAPETPQLLLSPSTTCGVAHELSWAVRGIASTCPTDRPRPRSVCPVCSRRPGLARLWLHHSWPTLT